MKVKKCIVCTKNTRPERRRSLKGARNQQCRKEVSSILRKSVTEEDFLCSFCNTKYHRGKLEESKFIPQGVEIPVYSIGNKSHKYCCICGHKPNNLKTVPADAHTQLFLKYKIILSSSSRCCPSHLTENKLIKDEAIIANQHRLKETKKIVKSDEMIQILNFAKALIEKSESRRIDFDQPHLLSDNDYYTLTGLTEEQFNDLVSGISFERKRKYSVRQSVGILFTKLRTGLSSSTLKTIFNINTSLGVCKIIRKARKALVAQFVPKFLGFNHISRDSVVNNHTTIFARELLASGNTDTAILILDGTYIYIETRGPGALCRAQEYHCNLALFFFSARKVHKLM